MTELRDLKGLMLAGDFTRSKASYYYQYARICAVDGTVNVVAPAISFDAATKDFLRGIYKQALVGKRFKGPQESIDNYVTQLAKLNETRKKNRQSPVSDMWGGQIRAGEIAFLARVRASEFDIIAKSTSKLKMEDGKPKKGVTYVFDPIDSDTIYALGGFALGTDGKVEVKVDLDGDYALFTGVAENISFTNETVRIKPELAEKFRKANDDLYLAPGAVWVKLERVTERSREKVDGKVVTIAKEVLQASQISMVTKKSNPKAIANKAKEEASGVTGSAAFQAMIILPVYYQKIKSDVKIAAKTA